MIPGLVSLSGAPWMVLPPGIHQANLSEIEVRYATNPARRELFGGLLLAVSSLALAGCAQLYLDGSYVTGKPVPGDYDALWNPVGVDPKKLDPVFFDFTNGRRAQKAKFKGEFFPSNALNSPSMQPFMDFFQIERFCGQRKGILSIDLFAVPPSTMRRSI